ncbi:MAG: hypothetical protein [Olavius algarvensis Gamma 1 endosymbiont]|nr:MAG: hypothetical protein [Olavius algarvensis Gamma 1 endosymbiont]
MESNRSDPPLVIPVGIAGICRCRENILFSYDSFVEESRVVR